MITITRTLLALLLTALTATHAVAAVTLTVGSASAAPADTVSIPVTLTNDGSAVATLFDVTFDDTQLTAGTPSGAAALNGHGVAYNETLPGTLRIIVSPPQNNAVLGSNVLVSIPFTVAANAPSGGVALTLTHVEVSDATAADVTYTAINGAITVGGGPNPDPDSDGMADAWELQYFGNTNRDGTGDYDGDGVTDQQEFLNGTNPLIADIPQSIAQSGMTLLSWDSQETVGEDGRAVNVLDGNPATLWHTQWSGSPVPLPPHEFVVDLGAEYVVTAFKQLPRQDGSTNGRIANYEFYVGNDPGNWGTAAASGTYAYSAAEQSVTLSSAQRGRYVRLVALSEAEGREWTSVAEFNVLGVPVGSELPFAATPAVSPNGGSFVDSVQVTLSSATATANIYYTLDGTAPTPSALLYGGPFILSQSTTVKAIAVADGYQTSSVSSSTFVVTPSQTDTPPLASAGGPYTGVVGTPISFDGSGSSDAEGVLTYTWNFGDGSVLTNVGAVPSYAYTASGSYTVTLTVTDTAGQTANATTTVTVNTAPAPTNLLLNAGFESGVNTPWTTTGTGGMETVNVRSGGYAFRVVGNPTNWPSVMQTVPVTAGETYEFSGWMKITGKTNTGTTGANYMFEVRWFNASGVQISGTNKQFGKRYSDTDYVRATVQQTAPAGAVRGGLRFQANQADGIGYTDDLSITRVSGEAPVAQTPSISANGGAFTDSVQVALTSATTTANIYYTLDGSTPNVSSIVYTGPFLLYANAVVKAIAVADGYTSSAIASAAFTVTASQVNIAPVAVDDTATTDQNVAITLNVLNNDSDTDGDVLTVDSVDAASLHGGTVTDNGDGTVTYTPAVGFAGTDTFSYTVTDGLGGFASAQVTVTVELVAFPVAETPAISPNGGAYVDAVDVTLTSATTVANIYYTLDGSTPTTASLLYTAPFRLTADATVNAIAVADGYQDSGVISANFTVAPSSSNSAPTALDDTATTDQNVAVTVSVLSNDTDIDGDVLWISAVDTTTAQAGVVVNNGDGTVTYTPALDFVGMDTFGYTVTDSVGGFATASVTVTVQASAPANLLLNAGFENGVKTPWTTTGTGGMETANARSGGYAYRVAGDPTTWPSVMQTVSVTAGETYEFSGWMKITGKTNTGTTGANYMFEVRWFNANGVQISGTNKQFGKRYSDTDYVRAAIQQTAPAGAVRGGLRFQANQTDGIGFTDDLSIVRVAP